jgi:hypothetical protein
MPGLRDQNVDWQNASFLNTQIPSSKVDRQIFRITFAGQPKEAMRGA